MRVDLDRSWGQEGGPGTGPRLDIEPLLSFLRERAAAGRRRSDGARGSFPQVSWTSSSSLSSLAGVGLHPAPHCLACSGFPESVPVYTVNRQCSSGLQALLNIAGTNLLLLLFFIFLLVLTLWTFVPPVQEPSGAAASIWAWPAGVCLLHLSFLSFLSDSQRARVCVPGWRACLCAPQVTQET